jgi:hypothetical protein
MAVVQVQNKFGQEFTSSTTQSLTFGSTATSGNLLVAAWVTQANAPSVVIPSGFTLAFNAASNVNASLTVAYKSSAGTETTITYSGSAYDTDCSMWIGEYSGLDSVTPDVSAISADSGGGSQTSLSTGTSGTTTVADTFCLSFMGATIGADVSTTPAWSNSFTQLTEIVYGAFSALSVADKTLGSTGTVETTFSTGGTGSELCAGLVIWPIATASSTVTDINTNEIVLENESDVTFTTTGFAGEITTFKLVSGAFETSLTGVTSTSGAGDADVPDFTGYDGTASSPIATTANNAIVGRLGDGTTTADLAITVNPRAGYEIIEVASAVKTVGSIYENVVEAVPDESMHYYSTANTTAVGVTGILTTDATSNFSVWWWNSATGITKEIEVTVTTGGVIGIIKPIISTIIKPIISTIID